MIIKCFFTLLALCLCLLVTPTRLPAQPGKVVKDVTDAVSEAANKLVSITPDGVQHLTGFFVNGAGSFVIQVGSITLNLVCNGKMPKTRWLTTEEYDRANDFFNNSLPPRETIIVTNLWGSNKRPYTIPNGLGLIYMNMGELYDNPFQQRRNDNEINGQVLVHELVHAWQIEHNPDLKTMKEGAINQWKYSILGDKSVYQYTCGKSWNEYNFEQQGRIAEYGYEVLSTSFTPGISGCEIPLLVQHIRNGKSFSQNKPAAPAPFFSNGYQPEGNRCIDVKSMDIKFMLYNEQLSQVLAIAANGKTYSGALTGNRLLPLRLLNGEPVAAKNGFDQFVFTAGNRLMVVTATGQVWAHTLVQNDELTAASARSFTVQPATLLTGDKILYMHTPGNRNSMERIREEPFRFICNSGNMVYGITPEGVVHVFEIENNRLTRKPFTGDRVAANANDHFVFAQDEYLYVVTHSGEVWRHRIRNNLVEPAEKCTGAGVAGNREDQFLFSIPAYSQNRLMVVRSDCGVWLQNTPAKMNIR